MSANVILVKLTLVMLVLCVAHSMAQDEYSYRLGGRRWFKWLGSGLWAAFFVFTLATILTLKP